MEKENQEVTIKEENKKDEYTSHKGLILLILCAIISIGLAVVCIFFSDEFFGLFIK